MHRNKWLLCAALGLLIAVAGCDDDPIVDAFGTDAGNTFIFRTIGIVLYQNAVPWDTANSSRIIVTTQDQHFLVTSTTEIMAQRASCSGFAPAGLDAFDYGSTVEFYYDINNVDWTYPPAVYLCERVVIWSTSCPDAPPIDILPVPSTPPISGGPPSSCTIDYCVD